jgi:hypothetical protein
LDVPFVDLRGPREVEGRESGRGANPNAHSCLGHVHPAVRLHLDHSDALYRAVTNRAVIDPCNCDPLVHRFCDAVTYTDVEHGAGCRDLGC